jgi:hypothetical protein
VIWTAAPAWTRRSRDPGAFSFHDGATVPARVVRNVLTKDVGLAEDEALELL